MYPIGKECKIRSIQVHGQDKKSVMCDNVWQLICSMLRKRNSARLCKGTAGKYEKYRLAG